MCVALPSMHPALLYPACNAMQSMNARLPTIQRKVANRSFKATLPIAAALQVTKAAVTVDGAPPFNHKGSGQ